MKLERRNTGRGFGRYEFKDRYGEECSLQKSSLATEDAIWFGCEGRVQVCVQYEGWKPVPLPEGALIHSRMHLTQEQVKALLPILQHFAETGDLP
jgi:hypothetical protein